MLGFFMRKVQCSPTPAPGEDELDELEESDEPPRGCEGTRRSERTPRSVSSAP